MDVTISGSTSLEVGVRASFTCSAACSPACTYTWTVYGSPVSGSSIDITLGHYVPTESISCQARNSVSGTTAAVNDTLTVSCAWVHVPAAHAYSRPPFYNVLPPVTSQGGVCGSGGKRAGVGW